MAKLKLKLGLGIAWITFGLLVIFSPRLFTTSTSLDNPRGTKVIELQSKMSSEGIKVGIDHAQRDMARAQSEIKEVKSKMPWTGQAPMALTVALQDAEDRLRSSQRQMLSLVDARETMLTQIRALTPVFSELAWEETRELFAKRQESHAGMSMTMWKYDMFFQLIFGGIDREGNVLAQIGGAIVQLLMRLSFGSVAALVDFAIRLPFWIKEYQLFEENDNIDLTPVASSAGSASGYEAMYERLEGQSASRPEEGRFVGGGGSWKSTIFATGFWLLALTGASLATLGILLVIWSPVIALLIFAIWKARQERGPRQRPQARTQRPPLAREHRTQEIREVPHRFVPEDDPDHLD
jgi:hypothetical protein